MFVKYTRKYLFLLSFLSLAPSFCQSDARAGGWKWLDSTPRSILDVITSAFAPVDDDLSDASIDSNLELKIKILCPYPLSEQNYSTLKLVLENGVFLEKEILALEHPELAAHYRITLSLSASALLSGYEREALVRFIKRKLDKIKIRIERVIADFKPPEEIIKTLHLLWNQPESADSRRKADETLEIIQKDYMNIYDRNYNWLQEDRVSLQRQYTSHSVSVGAEENVRENWLAAAQFVQKIGNSKVLWTDELLTSALKYIHYLVYGNQNSSAGMFREILVFCGTDPELIHWNGYIPPDWVEAEVEKYTQWLAQQIFLADQGQLNPIVLAARAFQRIISIHPFVDGNGRVSRLLVDLILRRYGIAPAILDTGGLAIFGRRSEFSNVPTDKALKALIKGIRLTYLLAEFDAKI